MKYELLYKINSPADLKALPDESIPALCAEIREFLIEAVSKNGGHLASNLGVVELTLAVHTVFDSPTDRIIFDVGHQSYIHKMITGRRDNFDDLRVTGGLSGFTLRRESEHDPFGAGHSSTSVSAALGFAEADKINGESRRTVCILGDGAYTGGMIHEALNNCKPDLPLVIILNENGMSISPNKGTFASYISRVRASRGYNRLKAGTSNLLDKLPLLGKPMKKVITALKNAVKRVVYSKNYFEELGLFYMGPIDGNDYEKARDALKLAKELNKTVVVHFTTVKGKGLHEAESSPDGYHSVSTKKASDSFNSAFASELISMAEEDRRIVAVTAAMGIGTGLDRFGERFGERYFDVGIAEPHALTFSAALAAGGLLPYTAIYSTFLQRGFDSIIHDIALQSLPVRLIIDRAGLSLGDGATHHGIFDVSMLSSVPEMEIFEPATYESLKAVLRYGMTSFAPLAVRYPNAAEKTELLSRFKRTAGVFSPLVDFDTDTPPEYIFITYGSLVSRVCEACDILCGSGHSAGVILIEQLKPIDTLSKLIHSLSGKLKGIVFAEEGIKCGGAGQALLSALVESGFDFSPAKYSVAAIDDSFAAPEFKCELYDYLGLSPEKLAKRMLDL